MGIRVFSCGLQKKLNKKYYVVIKRALKSDLKKKINSS